jgi:hypothetical protein
MSRWITSSLQDLLTKSPEDAPPPALPLDLRTMEGAMEGPAPATERNPRNPTPAIERTFRPHARAFLRMRPGEVTITRAREDAAAEEEAVEPPPPSAQVTTGNPFLDEMANDDLNLTVSLMCLEQLLGGMPNDRSIRAAAEALRCRIHELGDMRDALHDLYLAATLHEARGVRAMPPEGALAAFVKGLYLWSEILADAFEELALGMRALAPDWARLRERIEEGDTFYFDGLVAQIRRDLAANALDARDPRDPRGTFADDVEALLWAAAWLNRTLQKRFG